MGRTWRAPSRLHCAELAPAGGCWGSPGGQLKIRSLFGHIREAAVLSHPMYTWEHEGNSYCEELTAAGEEEQHPSISESGTWHLLRPNFW